VLGAFAKASARRATIGRLVYRSGGGIVTGSAVSLREGGCTASGPAGALATMASLSLFQGAVTARRVTLTRRPSIATSVIGLAVGGTRVSQRPGARIAVPGIGYLVTGPAVRVPVSQDAVAAGALALHLVSAHAGLPAGTVVLVAAVGLPSAVRVVSQPSPAKRLRVSAGRLSPRTLRAATTGQPLTVTPPLALHHYDFPVAGSSEYIDTYGAFRSDVPGNWHHGDDIFAPLGTPVVAVADGTINRVGWEKLGGWRLWVRDGAGDEFYYAHLSGYAPTDLHSDRVRAGEVVGFVGNTGDAFTTAPHLHFEVHPRQLLRLGYNGAVDPTIYLNRWTRLEHVVAPRPVHPPLPDQPQLRNEARYVFRELLAARHIVKHGPSLKNRPHVSIPAGANGVAPTPVEIARESAPPPLAAANSGSSMPTMTLLVALAGLLGACAAGGSVAVLRRRRRGR
jgi:murein DD-endopeptidase MepM/ murein hydrolase activator NlpD